MADHPDRAIAICDMSGAVNMRFTKLKTFAVSALLVGAAATPALATTVSAGGGTWDYGVNNNGGSVWSNYWHTSAKHGSSVQNGYGEIERSACVGADRWSYASLPAHPDKTDESFWRKC